MTMHAGNYRSGQGTRYLVYMDLLVDRGGKQAFTSESLGKAVK